jgi:serine phosphatase RsbU (regulator of sigma subunit)
VKNEEYGMSRLIDATAAARSLAPDAMLANCLADISTFRRGAPRFDDITLMGIRRQN